MRTFPLRIGTPDGLLFEGEVQRIVCRSITGDLAILAGHCNFCTALGMGEAHVILEDGSVRSAACIGGMLTVMDGNCSLLATTWEWQEDIDADRAGKAKERAQEKLAKGGLSDKEYKIYKADADADYDAVVEVDLAKVRPTVAFPHLPENTKTIDEVGDVPIQQVVIGSCTNGRLEDMALAAKILKGKKVHDDVRAIIIPATQQIFKDCIKKGYMDIFIDAGCVVSTPTCGPCLGGHMGILAEGERCVATTNRNFVGRMGHVKSEVYLASPAVAAASAITGKISGPDEIM